MLSYHLRIPAHPNKEAVIDLLTQLVQHYEERLRRIYAEGPDAPDKEYEQVFLCHILSDPPFDKHPAAPTLRAFIKSLLKVYKEATLLGVLSEQKYIAKVRQEGIYDDVITDIRARQLWLLDRIATLKEQHGIQ